LIMQLKKSKYLNKIIIPALFIYGLSILGWLYPEHRAITMIAIYDLEPLQRKQLDQLWTTARIGHESRLSESPADSMLGEDPKYIDYAAWPAISGDHSCSSHKLLQNVLETVWIIEVADVAARLERRLKQVGWERHMRMNVVRDSDIELQEADLAYATRAGSNNVHFLMARPKPDTDESEYLKECLMPGSELNAIGAYTWFHLSALLKAKEYTRGDLTPDEKSRLALAILADEAFALHFIEDTFASGHVAGTWGDVSMRKGTHDYYNEKGLDITTWDGESMVLLGDAWMRREDADRAARVVRLSIEQILQVLSTDYSDIEFATFEKIYTVPDTFNVCKENYMKPRDIDVKMMYTVVDILEKTPQPGLAEGLGELPRFRAELGPFVGFMAGFRGSSNSGGFLKEQSKVGVSGSLEIAVRLGIGLEGVMNESGDGLAFIDLGFRQDASTSSKIIEVDPNIDYGSITAVIPSRSAIVTRIRMPFWLIPGDLLIAAPILAFTSPNTLQNMGVHAANGGLIPWQSGMATSIGRFQFILGREIGFHFYGYNDEKDRVLAIFEESEIPILAVLDLRSIYFELPIIEYRPFRNFSLDQSSSTVIQLFWGLDVPKRVLVIEPDNIPVPETKAIHHFGFRIAFDWRSYL
jgi:hypothetical protein